jgi:transcriptional regulator with XRE-family HTH domain
MNGDRIGRAVRALRHRLDWTQAELGRRAGCSASVISRLERGNLRACSMATLERLIEILRRPNGALRRLAGGELERLLDADHAALQERWAARKAARWRASRQEVTYNHYGDRGSIDDLAFDPDSGTLLVSELKTGIYDAQRTLAKMDEKERLGARIAARFEWRVRRVVSCLVMADTRTNRRHVQQHEALFRRFNCRGRGAFAWLADPTPPVGGLLVFVPLSDLRGTHGRRAGRQRVRPEKGDPNVERGPTRAATARSIA